MRNRIKKLVTLCSSILVILPSYRTHALNPPVSLQEELGCSPTLSFILRRSAERPVYFDPLGLATDDNFAHMREAELKHGRIAMIGVITSITKTVAEQGSISYLLEGKSPPISQFLIREWSLMGSIVFILACGVCELLLLVQGSPRDMPGDYGLGYFGVRDKGKNERSLISELENGRLAMMVMLYYLLCDLQVFQKLNTGISVVTRTLLSEAGSR